MLDLSCRTGRLFQMLDEVSFIRGQGISSSRRLDELYGKMSDEQREINTQMVNLGEAVLSNVVFEGITVQSQMADYALRHFGCWVSTGEFVLARGLKNLLQFKRDVERFKDKRLETIEGDVLKEQGVNSGELSFEINKTFRSLYVVCEKNVFVNPNIFVEDLPRMEGDKGVVWATSYNTRANQYVGGKPPADFRLIFEHGCSQFSEV